MRKSIRRPLRKAGEQLGVQVPVLGLVLAAEDAALASTLEALLEFLRIHAAQEFLEGDACCDRYCGILRLELAEIVANRLDRSRARRQGRQQAHQRLIDPF